MSKASNRSFDAVLEQEGVKDEAVEFIKAKMQPDAFVSWKETHSAFLEAFSGCVCQTPAFIRWARRVGGVEKPKRGTKAKKANKAPKKANKAPKKADKAPKKADKAESQRAVDFEKAKAILEKGAAFKVKSIETRDGKIPKEYLED